eukprot:TRINITY_DN17144_c0_g1_i1.p1 TRINITY_DN17144_c0_g1~~TRINITY_DN17144_c0_g1_i1.p1  ORF type:complete len:483 (-),score=95.59 TRINITY_DN17144_c0_g1_i1:231-1679(-)
MKMLKSSSEESIPVAGFGFLSAEMSKEIEERMKAFLTISNIEAEDLSTTELEHFKCQNVVIPNWQELLPELTNKSVCSPFWDNASCVPPTLAGQTAVFPCMKMYREKRYSQQYNASRDCFPNSTWAGLTDYSSCKLLEEPTSEFEQIEVSSDLEISIVIYLVGHILSLLALSMALVVFASFREMRCIRHKVHIALFIAFGLADLAWILQLICQNIIEKNMVDIVTLYCVSWVATRLFHLTSFFWMFIEGLYLFLQVQFPLSLTAIRYKHFTIFGWGTPLLNMAAWVLLKHQSHHQLDSVGAEEDQSEQEKKMVLYYKIINCPFFEDNEIDFFVYNIPVFLLLTCNTFFLVWIMLIVVSKLKQRIAMDHDRRNLKAAKALVVLIPILGCPYLLTLVGPSREESPHAYIVFQIVRAVVLSTQGLVISLLYCFLNGEIQCVIRSHWCRWKMVRMVGRDRSYTQTSFVNSNLLVNSNGERTIQETL